jgi:hypothetical protein
VPSEEQYVTAFFILTNKEVNEIRERKGKERKEKERIWKG